MPFPVSQEKIEALERKMKALGILESDLEEQFVRSQGRGGQNVNKVSSCVVLIHLPSKTRIKCQEERSQGLNRYLARKRLCEKIEKELLGIHSAQEKERHKIRKQKKRRSRKLKMKIRVDKEKRQEKKNLRSAVRGEI
ncbi:MAG: peptide chain release factor-like protein [Chlamydiae bacterium]|nr:peptide chain release factor-like protein [Chlamydiota bacterium]MBI3277135.1 peptide chain release factor-like protein [Chlamydiota bacterium]